MNRVALLAGNVCTSVPSGRIGGMERSCQLLSASIAAVGQAVDRATSEWRGELRRRLRDRLDSLTLSVGVPGIARVESEFGAAARDTIAHGVREFEDVLRDTVAAARKEHRTGVVLFVDEIQEADADGLRTLAYAWQHLQSEGQDVPACRTHPRRSRRSSRSASASPTASSTGSATTRHYSRSHRPPACSGWCGTTTRSTTPCAWPRATRTRCS